MWFERLPRALQGATGTELERRGVAMDDVAASRHGS
jgi:hypothetical protein